MTVRVAISLLAGRGASILVTPRSNPAGEPNPNPPAAPFNLLPGDDAHEFVVDDPEGFTISELIGEGLETERSRRTAADRAKRADRVREDGEKDDGRVYPPSAPGRQPLGQDPAFNSERQPGAETGSKVEGGLADADRPAEHQALGHDEAQTRNDEGLGPREGESEADYHSRIEAVNRGEGPAAKGE